jgi:hypothetical protein
MAGISDLPRLHDIDADYSPQYISSPGAISCQPPFSPASTRCPSR